MQKNPEEASRFHRSITIALFLALDSAAAKRKCLFFVEKLRRVILNLIVCVVFNDFVVGVIDGFFSLHAHQYLFLISFLGAKMA